MKRLAAPVLAALAAFAVGCSSQNSTPTSPVAPSLSSPASLGLAAKASGGRVTNISVTTTVSDTDGSGNPTDIVSDGAGAYVDGQVGVSSILTTNGYNGIVWGDWQFDTGASTRGVRHGLEPDFVDTVARGITLVEPWSGLSDALKGKIEVECTFEHKNMLTMAANTSMTCGLINGWNANATTKYALNAAGTFIGAPEMTDVQIDCRGADSNGCNSWDIHPIGGDNPGAIGRLSTTITTKGKQTTGYPDGDFYLRFLIHVQR